MALDLAQERLQAHALLDLLPPAKLGAVRSLLEVMIDEDDEELTEEDRTAIQVGLDSLEKYGTVSMEEVLADFGLTLADFAKMGAEPDSISPTKPLG
jgi:aryl carrier-like protein